MELRGQSPPPYCILLLSFPFTLPPSPPPHTHHFPPTCILPSSLLTHTAPPPSPSLPSPFLTHTAPPPSPRVDSVTWNPHKSLNVPLQCSAILLQHNGVLQNCNSTRADYLFQQDKVNSIQVYSSIQEYTRVFKSILSIRKSIQEYVQKSVSEGIQEYTRNVIGKQTLKVCKSGIMVYTQ